MPLSPSSSLSDSSEAKKTSQSRSSSSSPLFSSFLFVVRGENYFPVEIVLVLVLLLFLVLIITLVIRSELGFSVEVFFAFSLVLGSRSLPAELPSLLGEFVAVIEVNTCELIKAVPGLEASEAKVDEVHLSPTATHTLHRYAGCVEELMVARTCTRVSSSCSTHCLRVWLRHSGWR